MTIEQAAEKLREQVQFEPWFVAVGIGNGELFLYVTQAKAVPPQIDVAGFEGFPVTVRRSGRFKPAGQRDGDNAGRVRRDELDSDTAGA